MARPLLDGPRSSRCRPRRCRRPARVLSRRGTRLAALIGLGRHAAPAARAAARGAPRCSLLVAALPWEDALGLPDRDDLGGQAPRACCCSPPGCCAPSRATSAWSSPDAHPGGVLRARRRAVAAALARHRRPAWRKALRYVLFVVFFFLVVQLTGTVRDVRRIAARDRPLGDARRRLGAVPVRLRSDDGPRRRPDRGSQRLRVLHRVRPAARRLPDGARPPMRVPWALSLRAAGRDAARHAVARRPGRPRGARGVGRAHPPRAARRRRCRRREPS